MSLSFKPIKSLLQTGAGKTSRWFSFIGLGVGVLLLLCSIQVFVNIQQLLNGKTVRKIGFDFIAVTKKVTNENMGQPGKTFFTQADIEELSAKTFISDVAPLVSTNFQLELAGPDALPFKTNLFLESIRNDFIDSVPPGFEWREGQTTIPMIISSDFLEVFNVFGPGYGLPQISPETVSGIPVLITCRSEGGIEQTFTGKIAAFTDRINSTLVPLSFIEWANIKFSGKNADHYTRLYIKTRDANNPELLNFLDQKSYKINKDKTRFGRIKQVVQAIFSGLGVFGLLVIILSLMLFSFYLQLVIAKSKENLQLLLTLGYSPKWLGKHVSGQLMPVYSLVIFAALLLTELMQWSFHHFIMNDRQDLSSLLNWLVVLVALLLLFLSFFLNYSLVKRLLHQLR